MSEKSSLPDDFVFRPEDHTYLLKAQILPSVTQILSGCGLIHEAAEDYLIRGRVVHRCCELLARGKLDWKTVDPRVDRWVLSYEKFLKHQRWVANAVEFSSYSQAYLFAGTWDADFTDNWLLDLKTGGPAKWHKLQLGGYWHLNGEKKKSRCGTLYLQEDASIARLVEHNGREAWLHFRVFLDYYNLRDQYV
jgi:hypothetical protein